MFEGHFSLGCHFHVHFINPWHAFASHGLPAIAELLVILNNNMVKSQNREEKSGEEMEEVEEEVLSYITYMKP